MIHKLLAFVFTLSLLAHHDVSATYIPVYTVNTNGGLSFTGNTLGLNKAPDQNQPGTSGSLGAFITTDTSSQVGNYPPGTTLIWQNNSSSAVLDIPTNSTILYAELIWSGSYGFGNTIPLSSVDVPITLITPDNVSHVINLNPATAQSRAQNITGGFYVRSADVTSLVSNISGTYTVAGVPATIVPTENNSNCAGWTLAVAYSNTQMLTSNLTIFVGCEASGAPPAVVNGFHAPTLGDISSVLFSSSLEGDAQIIGDRFLIGSTAALSYPANAISATNNPANNFFSSQINTTLPLAIDPIINKLRTIGSAMLDTRGTFGPSNSNALTGIDVTGARQGYDITAIDIGSLIVNDQVQFYAQGTTSQDVYTVTSLGVQIQVLAPVIQAVKTEDQSIVTAGSVVTYTSTFTNTGEAAATGLIFTDPLPAGMVFVPNSLTVNGNPVSGADIVNGVPLGNLGVNQSVEVIFQAQVIDINPPTSFKNASMVTYTFVPLNSEAPTVGLVSQTNTAIATAQVTPPPVANPDSASIGAGSILSGLNVLTNDIGNAIFVSAFDSTSAHGGIVVVQANGTYTYIPPTGFSGVDTFNYTITDSKGQTASTTVTITVPPVTTQDTASVGANTSLTQTTSVLNNDIGSGLTVSTYDSLSNKGGTVTMQPDGTYTYMPALNFSGIDTFNYIAVDSSGQTAIGIVTISVLPIAQNNFGTTPANVPLNGSTVFTNDVGTGLTLVNFTPFSVQGGQVVMDTTDGTYVYTPPANFSGTDTFTYTVQDQSEQQTTATVTITVLPVAVNDTGTTFANVPLNQTTSVLANDAGSGLHIVAFQNNTVQGGTVVMQSDGMYVYTPPLGYSGPDAFSYIAKDGIGNETTARVFLTVLPVANPDTATTSANTPFLGTSVLNNDVGTQLSIQNYQSSSTQGGSVLMNVDGTYTYTPPTGFSGTDTFTYTAADFYGNLVTTTVTVTVLPVVNNETYTTSTNAPLSGNVLTNDIGTGLTVTPGTQTTAQGGTVVLQPNGTFIYTPPLNFTGTDSFTYTVRDSSGQTAVGTATILVVPVTPPRNVIGHMTTYKFLNKNDCKITLTWSASIAPGIIAYRIYNSRGLVAELPANQLTFAKCIPCSEAVNSYYVTAINSGGIESAPANIRMTR